MKLKNKILLSLFFLVSFLIRLAVHWLDPVLSRDGCVYIQVAEFVFENGSFDSVLSAFPAMASPPLFVSLIVLLMHCGLSAETAAVFINIVSGTFVPFISAGIAWEFSRSKKMFCSVLVLAICHPFLIKLSGEAQRDMLYLFFIGIFFLLICFAFSRQHWGYCAAAGSAFALAVLTRYESLEFIPILLLFSILSFIFKFKQWKKTVYCISAFCFSVFLVVVIFIPVSRCGQYLKTHYQKICFAKYNSVVRFYSTDSED